jgi:hypothetical protein
VARQRESTVASVFLAFDALCVDGEGVMYRLLRDCKAILADLDLNGAGLAGAPQWVLIQMRS